VRQRTLFAVSKVKKQEAITGTFAVNGKMRTYCRIRHYILLRLLVSNSGIRRQCDVMLGYKGEML
jgi:hypothetical protein